MDFLSTNVLGQSQLGPSRKVLARSLGGVVVGVVHAKLRWHDNLAKPGILDTAARAAQARFGHSREPH
jgi:hypothetical protein